jgi:hypothetical protein
MSEDRHLFIRVNVVKDRDLMSFELNVYRTAAVGMIPLLISQPLTEANEMLGMAKNSLPLEMAGVAMQLSSRLFVAVIENFGPVGMM